MPTTSSIIVTTQLPRYISWDDPQVPLHIDEACSVMLRDKVASERPGSKCACDCKTDAFPRSIALGTNLHGAKEMPQWTLSHLVPTPSSRITTKRVLPEPSTSDQLSLVLETVVP